MGASNRLFWGSFFAGPIERAIGLGPLGLLFASSVLAVIGLGFLGIASYLPGVMALCFLLLILYFKSMGGYRPQEATAEAV